MTVTGPFLILLSAMRLHSQAQCVQLDKAIGILVIVCAAVILKENESLTEEEIIAYCKENIASYKKPRKVIFCESFPRNALGKVQKGELKRMV